MATNGPDLIIGDDTPEFLDGLLGNDTISGRGGDDILDGNGGRDTVDYRYSSGGWSIDLLLETAISLSGSTVEDIFNFEDVFGSQGNDQIWGDNGRNNLEGEDGNDFMYGDGGNDTLQGENGIDELLGSFGNDVLIGGPGNDSLYGGTGDDQFVYRLTSESTGSAGDRIGGFALGRNSLLGDKIVLRQIDADTTLDEDQAFRFLGERTDAQGLAQGPGALWVHDDSDSNITFLHGNVNNNATIELTIRIADGTRPADLYLDFDFIL